MPLAALFALLLAAQPAPPEVPQATARRIALAALERVSAFDKLPRFSYAASYRNGSVESLGAVDATLESFRKGLTAPVPEKNWFSTLETLSWDEAHFVAESGTPKDGVFQVRMWTKAEAWSRNGRLGAPARFVRQSGPGGRNLWRPWRGHDQFHCGYLRAAPHAYWWGRTATHKTTMSHFPPEETTWRHLGAETVGGEECDVVEGAERYQRLWVGRQTGRVLAVLAYLPDWTPEQLAKGDEFYKSQAAKKLAGREFISAREYGDWLDAEATDEQRVQHARTAGKANVSPPGAPINLGEYVELSDYREVAPGVWVPLREARSFLHYAENQPSKRKVIRSELRVQQVRAGDDLTERYRQYLPRVGEAVQDCRFGVLVEYKFDPARAENDIRAEADAKWREQLRDAELVTKMLEPLEALLKKPAPVLPAEGWVNGKVPAVAGRPYLVQFWATWCGPCKGDLPSLKQLAESGVTVVGMHPPDTPAKEVGEAAGELKMTWPTFAAPGNGNAGGAASDIAGYKVGVFPWYVLVGADGKVLAHGRLDDLLQKHGAEAMRPRK